MKKETISRITLALVLLGSAAFGMKAIAAATELARVNGAVITLQDFEKHYQQAVKFLQYKAPAKKTLLDEEIKRLVGIQQARKMGLDKDPEVIEQMNNVLFQAYVTKKLRPQVDAIHVTDDEAKDYYSKYPEVRVSHIFVALRPDAKKADIDDAAKRIREIEGKLGGHASFAEVAQKFSEGNATMGGDMGWQTREELDPNLYNAAVKLGVGSVSGPVKSPYGYHLVKLTGKKSWDEVDHAAVKRAVFNDRQRQIYETFATQLRNQANVVVHPELLKD